MNLAQAADCSIAAVNAAANEVANEVANEAENEAENAAADMAAADMAAADAVNIEFLNFSFRQVDNTAGRKSNMNILPVIPDFTHPFGFLQKRECSEQHHDDQQFNRGMFRHFPW